VYTNAGVDLGVDASFETLEPEMERVLDMSEAQAGSSFQSANA